MHLCMLDFISCLWTGKRKTCYNPLSHIDRKICIVAVLVLDTQAAPGIACDTVCYNLHICSGADTTMEQERILVQLCGGD